jgi:hypothetical protein
MFSNERREAMLYLCGFFLTKRGPGQREWVNAHEKKDVRVGIAQGPEPVVIFLACAEKLGDEGKNNKPCAATRPTGRIPKAYIADLLLSVCQQHKHVA